MSTLAIEQKESKLNNIKLSETIDVKILDKLIQSDLLQTIPWINEQTGMHVCYDNEKSHLLAIRKKVKKTGLLEVNYKSTKVGFGRVYAQKSLSLGSIRRELRHTLCKELYTDIDVDNCHPVILKQICEKNNVECKYLTKYVLNRKKYLQQVIDTYGTTRDVAKNLFIRLAYFGSFNAWKDEFNIESTKTLKFIENYTMELKCIGLQIVSANPKLLKTIQKMDKKNDTASLVSTILQEHEKRILECVYSHLQLIKAVYNNAVLCFDGIMIPTKYYDSKLLKQLSEVVKDVLQFDVNFTQKDMDQDYLEQIKDIVDTDSFEYKSQQFELTHCKIVNKSIYLKKTHNDSLLTFTKKALIDAYEHDTCDGDEDFIQKWTKKNPKIRRYDDVDVYPPPMVCPDNEYNLWLPFKMSKYSGDYEKNEEGLEYILNHIKVICDNDEVVQNYVTKWIAQMLQFPATKTSALSFVGLEGSGKSSIIRICEALIGKNKCLETTVPSRDCWGDHNSLMLSAFLVSIAEMTKKEYMDGSGQYKGIITDPTLIINPKGKDQFETKSFHRVINTSNKDDPVKTSVDDRRNVIIRVSDELKGNDVYFEKLYKHLEDVNTLRTLYDHLMAIPNMAEFNRIPLPKTKHQEELRKLDRSAPEQFLCDLAAFAIKPELTFTGKEMFELFDEWKQNNGVQYEASTIKFGMKLSVLRIPGFTTEHKATGNVRILNTEIMKKHFNI